MFFLFCVGVWKEPLEAHNFKGMQFNLNLCRCCHPMDLVFVKFLDVYHSGSLGASWMGLRVVLPTPRYGQKRSLHYKGASLPSLRIAYLQNQSVAIFASALLERSVA